MFGLGGVSAEVLGDVGMALSPLSPGEAQRLVSGIRGRRLLERFRGGPVVRHEALVDGLLRLSRLVERFPEIRELDVNPWMGDGESLWAVDGRIELDVPG